MLENEKKAEEIRKLESKIGERNKKISALLEENSKNARRISEIKANGA